MPYIKRAQQLDNTFFSFNHWYSARKDWEVIVIEDKKNYDNRVDHQALKNVFKKWDHLPIFRIDFPTGPANPAPLFNIGVKLARSDYLILTNPECFHPVDILSGFDILDLGQYIICACESRKNVIYNIGNIGAINGDHHMWYQHSKIRNVCYHFCNCISAKNYALAGGFNEAYANGYGYEDNDFRDRVTATGLKFIVCDDLFVIHQWHEQIRPDNWMDLLAINKTIYQKK